MRNNLLFSLIVGIVLLSVMPVFSQGATHLFSGGWGKEVNQLGIRFPAPNVMPVAPYECIGGYDIDADGRMWFSDSINSMLKCYINKNWSYIMLNYGKLGDLVCFGKKLYVLTRNPDGIAVVSPETGRVDRHIKISFQSPGRLKVLSDKLILIEEQGKGLMICKNDLVALHPAAALEAVATENRLFGVQFNYEPDSRTIISAELADEVQEPETIGLYEAGETIVFSKMAGVFDKKPVLMVVTKSNPEFISFVKLGENAAVENKIQLPVYDCPFLTSSWKLCSDGNLYGFNGTASEGFKIYRSEHNL